MIRIFNTLLWFFLLFVSMPIFAAGTPASITITKGAQQSQSQSVSTKFSNPLSVTVTDRSGSPVSGVRVTFTASSASGAGATFLSNGQTILRVTTDANGVAAPYAVANTIVGGPYAVSAVVSGISIPVHFSLTNTTDSASTITASNGTSLTQSTVVNTPLAAPLSVTVTDMFGDPIVGAPVSFHTVCTNGSACGSFLANSGTNITIVTNAQGIAAPVLTANTIAGAYAVSASVSGIITPVTFTVSNRAGNASLITTRGTTQKTKIGSAFFSPFAVTVTDAYGNPISNTPVTLTAPALGASGTFPNGHNTIQLTTTSDGRVSSTFTANTTIGAYDVSAVADAALATFHRINAEGTTTLAMTSGTSQAQSIVVGHTLSSPFSVTITDQNNDPVAGVSVTFTAPSSGASGTFTSSSSNSVVVISNVNGIAAAPAFVANTSTGTYDVTASDGTNSLTYFVTNTPGAASSISITSGTPQMQSATVNTAFADNLSVTVQDQYGNAVPNAFVTFTASCTSTVACGTFEFNGNSAVQVSASNGIAEASIFTANKIVGSYTITASVTGATSAIFNLSNTTEDESPSLIMVNGGDNQHTAAGSVFSTALSVLVTDQFNNPMSGVSVTFASPGSGASSTLSGSAVTTNTSGIASVTATANTTTGSYAVTAKVNNTSPQLSFSLTNDVGSTVTVATNTSTTPQTQTVGVAFSTALGVTVQDQYGNPAVANTLVTFTADCLSTAACGTFANGSTVYSAPTNGSGVVTAPAFTANALAGTYTVTAAATGASSATFTLTNTLDTTKSLSITSGTPQNQTQKVAHAFGSPFSVTLLDGHSNPISGVTVTFAAPGSGASGTFANGSVTTTAVTSTDGVAIASTFTANTTSGTYAVTATPAVTTAPTSVTFNVTNTADSAVLIAIHAGDSQSAIVGQSFSTSMSALVTDQYGNGVSNTTVTFAAPTSGQSGVFPLNGNSTIKVVSDSTGVATASTFNANTVAGAYQVSASVLTIAASAKFNLTNTSLTTATSIAITSGTSQSQSVTVGTAFSALSVTVTDQYGNPVSGKVVTFTAPSSSSPSVVLSSSSVTTNSSGIAAPTATANTHAGSYTVSAQVTTGSGTATTNFSLTNTAGLPTAIAVSGSSSQSTAVGTAFSSKLSALVTDSAQNPVSGITVTFAPSCSSGVACGTFSSGATAITNSAGIAVSSVLTANTIIGTYTMTATAPGASGSAVFTLTNTSGTPTTIAITSGTSQSQSAAVGTVFSPGLSVTVKDQYNNLVSGVTVTFTAPSSGLSGTFSNSTNTISVNTSSGIAAPTFTANTQAGGPYTVSAAVSGISTSVYFAFTNTAGEVASIEIVSGNNQAVAVESAFAPLQVRVLDTGNNPVSGAIVTFNATPTDGATGSFPGGGPSAGSVTDVNGIATAPTFTANCVIGGPYTVTASFESLATVAFSLTNTVGAPTSIAINGGNNQSAGVGVAFSMPLSVILKNQCGSPVPNVVVTFMAPASGASVAFATTNTATTDSSGIATSTVATANSTVGSYSVSASYSPSPLVSFSLENIILPPTVTGVSPSVGPTTGNQQVVITGTSFTTTQTVLFGGTAISFVVDSDTQITVHSPPNQPAGTVDIQVVNQASTGSTSVTSPADQYTFVVSSPPLMLNNSAPGSINSAGTATYIITNSGGSPITGITADTTPADDLTVANNACSGTLNPGVSCTIAFSTSNVTNDASSGKYIIISGTGMSTMVVPISAINIKVMSPPYSDSTVNMLLVEGCMNPQTLEVINNANGDALVVSPVATGDLSVTFNNNCSFPLLTNQVCSVEVINNGVVNETGTIQLTVLDEQWPANELPSVSAKVESVNSAPPVALGGFFNNDQDVVFSLSSGPSGTGDDCNTMKLVAYGNPIYPSAVSATPWSVNDQSHTVPTGIYEGQNNTISILQSDQNGGSPISSYSDDVAGQCVAYAESTAGGGVTTNWYLPSICELAGDTTGASGTSAGCPTGQNNMYSQLYPRADAGTSFPAGFFWSSTENDATSAWYEKMQTPPDQHFLAKSTTAGTVAYCASSFTY